MYKPGDLVKIVDAQSDIEDMQKMIGMTATIKKGSSNYWILEENPMWGWVDRWLQPVTENEIKINESDWKEVCSKNS